MGKTIYQQRKKKKKERRRKRKDGEEDVLNQHPLGTTSITISKLCNRLPQPGVQHVRALARSGGETSSTPKVWNRGIREGELVRNRV